jgi:dihydroorotate dehydrogenase
LPKTSIHTTPISCLGLTFPNRLGLAAGLDKNGEYIDALAALGFGFIEIGTITPKPQPGNLKPRLFRLVKSEALINRLGFPSEGMDKVAARLEKIKYRGILGINIGKNKETPIEKAADDYVAVFQRLWRFASYITVNISSPNTAQLRELHKEDYLVPLLSRLKSEQEKILHAHQRYIPLVVKISPDLTHEELEAIAAIFIAQRIDGVIATNTTTSRDGLTSPLSQESGGLSGKPLQQKSAQTMHVLHTALQGRIPIIGCGGILDHESAEAKTNQGATLLQLYTGLIYRGPGLIKRLV